MLIYTLAGAILIGHARNQILNFKDSMLMNKKLLVLPLSLMMVQPAFANVNFIPNLNITSLGGSPNAYLDIIAEQSGLSGTFSKTATSTNTTEWTLKISGTGIGLITTPTYGDYTVINNHYSLVADFSTKGTFLDGSVSITGNVLGLPGANGSLLTENLTAFGYNAKQDVIGFDTVFTGGYGSNPAFTGGPVGKTGDVSYLFDPTMLQGSSSLSFLINEFVTGKFSQTSFYNVESLTAVPLPLPAILFASGLTALMGMGRARKTQNT